MNTITELFQQAQLAEASYANFVDANGNLITTDAGVTGALIAASFSQDHDDPTQSTQATAFVAEWDVLSQLPNTSSGFSATLFKNAAGDYEFVVRGSENVFSSGGLVDWGGADFGDSRRRHGQYERKTKRVRDICLSE
ncbi:MAG: hypothetical protein WAO76_05420 [Georgfuchsia sp.]